LDVKGEWLWGKSSQSTRLCRHWISCDRRDLFTIAVVWFMTWSCDPVPWCTNQYKVCVLIIAILHKICP